jgi:hypothetical protein
LFGAWKISINVKFSNPGQYKTVPAEKFATVLVKKNHFRTLITGEGAEEIPIDALYLSTSSLNNGI